MTDNRRLSRLPLADDFDDTALFYIVQKPNSQPSSRRAPFTLVRQNLGAVLRTGDTMTGALTLFGAPTADLHAATKKYVDDGVTALASASSTFMAKASNLSDLASPSASRTNLGLTADGSSLVTAANYTAMKVLLSLDQAENKSSATIRGELISGNVTTALGYTPLRPSNNLSDVSNAGTARTNLGLTANGSSLVTVADYAAMKVLLGLTVGTDVQAFDSDLSALAANSTNGLWARTGMGAGAARTLTGTAAEITVTNGDGVAGAPTVSLPAALTFTGKTITSGTYASPTMNGTPQSTAGFRASGTSTFGSGSGVELAYSASVGYVNAYDYGAAAYRPLELGASPGAGLRMETTGVANLQSGKLQFPATQSAAADANTLDDYEEGTFTPTLAIGGSSVGVTYSSRSANYTKVGNQVRYWLEINLTSTGGLTGNVTVTGLPFTAADSDVGTGYIFNPGTSPITPTFSLGGAIITPFAQPSLGSATQTAVSNTSTIRVSGVYRT